MLRLHGALMPPAAVSRRVVTPSLAPGRRRHGLVFRLSLSLSPDLGGVSHAGAKKAAPPAKPPVKPVAPPPAADDEEDEEEYDEEEEEEEDGVSRYLWCKLSSAW